MLVIHTRKDQSNFAPNKQTFDGIPKLFSIVIDESFRLYQAFEWKNQNGHHPES